MLNYPSPFNPETWLPYHLSKPAEVTLTIYAVDGQVVRHLDLGYQAVGFYQSKSRAAHWDGRNAVGERVASGLYFYTLTAGDFTATRKMLIQTINNKFQRVGQPEKKSAEIRRKIFSYASGSNDGFNRHKKIDILLPKKV